LDLPADATLLIIDVQEGMHEPSMGSRNNPDAERTLGQVLAAWRSANRPLIHVRHNSTRPDSVFHPAHPGNEIQPFAQPRAGEVLIEKQANCAFVGTDLEQRLRTSGTTTLVITGFVTNHCVETTARIAGDLGFTTYVVSDACAAFDRTGPAGQQFSGELIHNVSLTSIHDEFATVVTASEVLDALPLNIESPGSE
jgi:nicotinamidase-related amidase